MLIAAGAQPGDFGLAVPGAVGARWKLACATAAIGNRPVLAALALHTALGAVGGSDNVRAMAVIDISNLQRL